MILSYPCVIILYIVWLALHYIALHYITLHRITLHYILLHLDCIHCIIHKYNIFISYNCVYGYESKPWYPSEPQITGKWMFIPLKMVLIHTHIKKHVWRAFLQFVTSHGALDLVLRTRDPDPNSQCEVAFHAWDRRRPSRNWTRSFWKTWKAMERIGPRWCLHPKWWLYQENCDFIMGIHGDIHIPFSHQTWQEGTSGTKWWFLAGNII